MPSAVAALRREFGNLAVLSDRVVYCYVRSGFGWFIHTSVYHESGSVGSFWQPRCSARDVLNWQCAALLVRDHGQHGHESVLRCANANLSRLQSEHTLMLLTPREPNVSGALVRLLIFLPAGWLLRSRSRLVVSVAYQASDSSARHSDCPLHLCRLNNAGSPSFPIIYQAISPQSQHTSSAALVVDFGDAFQHQDTSGTNNCNTT